MKTKTTAIDHLLTHIEQVNSPLTATTLLVKFNLRLKGEQLKLFREGMIRASGDPDQLFSNEVYSSDLTLRTFIYRYPMIQYRIINGRAAIFAFNEGAKAMKQFLKQNMHKFLIGDQEFELHAYEQVHSQNISLEKLPHGQMQRYQLKHWLPLHNQEDYDRFTKDKLMSDIEKTQRLEEKLTHHIAEFCGVLRWQGHEQDIQVNILRKSDTIPLKAAGRNQLGFDLLYTCNILLPQGIGLGKYKSKGFGVNERIEED